MSLASFAPISTTGRTLSEEQLAQYNRDGYIIVRGLLDSEEIGKMKALHARAEVLSQERGESFKLNGAHYDVEALPPGHPQGKAVALRKIQEVFKSEQDYVDVMSSEKVLDIVADLIGDDIYYHSSKLMCKPAHGGRRKPWHQDWAYWQEMNTNQVTMWCAIDPSTRENGCIQAIPGSHKRGYVEHSHQEDYMIDEFGIENEHILPISIILYPNYPNPFNSNTAITIYLSKPEIIDLSIIDVMGNTVKKLMHEKRPIGNSLINWDGTNMMGESVTSGIYFSLLKVDGRFFKNKIVLLK